MFWKLKPVGYIYTMDHPDFTVLFVCLFDLTLYVPVNNFSAMSGRFLLG